MRCPVSPVIFTLIPSILFSLSRPAQTLLGGFKANTYMPTFKNFDFVVDEIKLLAEKAANELTDFPEISRQDRVEKSGFYVSKIAELNGQSNQIDENDIKKQLKCG